MQQLCVNTTSKYGDNKSIGWDVAIKQDGPILIEGNHDWGQRVWQIPAGTGLKRFYQNILISIVPMKTILLIQVLGGTDSLVP